MKNHYQQVGKRIRFIRKREELTQAQLAEKVGLSDNYIGLIERGAGHPTLETLGQIADVLRVGIGDFFLGENAELKDKHQTIKEIDRFLMKREDKDARLLLNICKAIAEYNPK